MKTFTLASAVLATLVACSSSSRPVANTKAADPKASETTARQPAGDCCCSYNETGESAYITMTTAECKAKPADATRKPECVEMSMCAPVREK